MDWFHCTRCCRQRSSRFALTTCGHLLCSSCGDTGPCPICATACRYLPLCPQMGPQQKLLFQSPADVALKHLTRISQVWRFQRAQSELLIGSHQEAARRARAALEETREVLETRNRELEALRRENRELRRAQLSPGWRGGSRSSTPRPVGVTSPAQTVAPQPPRHLSGQVVSRPLEPPPPRRPPLWQPRPRPPSPPSWMGRGLTQNALRPPQGSSAAPPPESPLFFPAAMSFHPEVPPPPSRRF